MCRQSLRLRGRKGVLSFGRLHRSHLKVNTRTKGGENPTEEDSPRKIHPARRWVVQRTISWLVKRRSLRTRWAKKAEKLAGARSACLRPHLAQPGGFRIESNVTGRELDSNVPGYGGSARTIVRRAA